jgi:hypothetical protein
MSREKPVTHRSPSKPERGLTIALCVAALVVVVIAASWMWSRSSDPEVSVPATVPVATSLPVPAEPPPPVPDLLTPSFAELAGELPGEVGLAFAPLSDPAQVTTLGAWSHGPAWSTIKVPLALALLRETGGTASPAMASAITASDNSAAQSIWEQLGGGATAAGKVRDVLAAGGDANTVVPSEVQRPGFSIFGQADWSLADQVRFVADAACDGEDTPVIALMSQIVSGQRWGLGGIDGAYFKGGWGPGTDGLYLVRQFGVVPTNGGEVAVSIAAVANSGGFADGTAMLDRIAGWLQNHVDEIGGGACPPVGTTPS